MNRAFREVHTFPIPCMRAFGGYIARTPDQTLRRVNKNGTSHRDTNLPRYSDWAVSEKSYPCFQGQKTNSHPKWQCTTCANNRESLRKKHSLAFVHLFDLVPSILLRFLSSKIFSTHQYL